MPAATEVKLVCDSLEQLIAPETLSEIEGRRITEVHVEDLSPNISHMGSRFLSVRTGAGRSGRYVVKLMNWRWDWIMRITDDRLCREVQLWKHGVLDDLPPELMSPILGCSADGDGWALLMRDVDRYFVRRSKHEATGGEHCLQFMDALAALHARYWEAPQLEIEAAGFCRPELYLHFASPELRRQAGVPEANHRERLRLHACAREVLDPDVFEIVTRLRKDPRPLCDALARYPRTLVHGDFSCRNLGVMGERTVVTDWQLATRLPGSVDMGWTMISFHDTRPDLDGLVAAYRKALARRLSDRLDPARWEEQMRLGLLGSFIFIGLALFINPLPGDLQREEIAWWSDRIREGVELL